MIIIINRMLVYMHNIHACDSIYRKESIIVLCYSLHIESVEYFDGSFMTRSQVKVI